MKKLSLLILLVVAFIFITHIPFTSADNRVLSWIASADDEGEPSEGPVDHYKLVYSTTPITEANFDTCIELPTDTPLNPGETESYTYDLPLNAHYYFAIKSYDADGNESPISNVTDIDFLAPSPITTLEVQ